MLKHLSNLNKLQLERFLSSFDRVFCDVDGVIWMHNGTPFNGVRQTLRCLSKMNKKIHFVTNNQFVAMESAQSRLKVLVPDLSPEDVVTPVSAMIHYLKDVKFDKGIFYLGPKFCREMFQRAGLKVKDAPLEAIEESIDSLVAQAVDDESVGAVIYDFDVNLNYAKLLRAVTYLRRRNVLFLIGPLETCTIIRGNVIVGPGMFKNLLETFSGRLSTSFAKPSQAMANYLIKKFEISDTSRVLCVGDSISNDVAFGNRCGYQTLLVLHGALEKINCNKHENLLPKYVINMFGDLHEIIEEKHINVKVYN